MRRPWPAARAARVRRPVAHIMLVLAAAVQLAVSAPAAPDLVVTFDPSSMQGPKARPATRAVAGLLNGGPEFGAKFLNPLHMGNYRGLACQSPSAYAAMVQAGATNIQCDMDEMAANCTALPPNLNDTSMCSVWPGRDGDWTPWEKRIAELVASKAGPKTSWGVWNEPNDGFWPGCTSGCATPDPTWLMVWNRTVRAIRVRPNTRLVFACDAGLSQLLFTCCVDGTAGGGQR